MEGHPVHQKVGGLTPSWGAHERQPIAASLDVCLSPFLSKSNEEMSSGKEFKKKKRLRASSKLLTTAFGIDCANFGIFGAFF